MALLSGSIDPAESAAGDHRPNFYWQVFPRKTWRRVFTTTDRTADRNRDNLETKDYLRADEAILISGINEFLIIGRNAAGQTRYFVVVAWTFKARESTLSRARLRFIGAVSTFHSRNS